ncbi:2-dehydro-3-deoxy-6-phosphogalactonate aldolase [Streptomyces antnestii]|uniref:2-dehydro-3-deoxy-6-phosphogalactonate aldolase n=1 Tax=Streptomyces antnestii TaxID=2494256 RepID=A0A437P0P4_9ACTN|nr:2-dehydro-3-deoxy-6-phosphogalactonate aldolase [Streptomyces sp. San01]RVU15869.1 2-dehydro-3-deoxy-6-phosphogalactonate aldolase [Streptomyces sp. San01]
MTGLIAILRGVEPAEVVGVGRALAEAGVTTIEVPLNSPAPFTSVRLLADALGERCVIGAGTVLTVDDVARARAAGARIVVAPNCDRAVIAAAVGAGLTPYPGVATPSEAFAAIGAGARQLKVFPADSVGIDGVKAWRAVLPPDVGLVPVGGVDGTNLAAWAAAGVAGVGLGSGLYRPGDPAEVVGARARELRRIWQEAVGRDADGSVAGTRDTGVRDTGLRNTGVRKP